jgi:hypothetical protein
MKHRLLLSMRARLVIRVRVAVFLCAGTATAAGGTDILWNSTILTLRPGPKATSARGRFSFVSNGPRPVTIEQVKSTCGCMAARAAGAPEDGRYVPGATGHIDAEVSFTPEWTNGTYHRKD